MSSTSDDTGQPPTACPGCGYSEQHADDCPAVSDQIETVPESPAPARETEDAQAAGTREVVVREGRIEAPEPSFGWTIHGDPAAIYPDFIEAQANMDDPRCTETAKVKTKSGYTYSFSYAPLEEILRAVKPALNGWGFGILQPPHAASDGNWIVRCLLLHESGGYIEATASIPQKSDMQKLGSEITYLRRYMLEGLTGVSAREDDDANVAAGNKVEKANQDAESEASNGDSDQPDPEDMDDPSSSQMSYIKDLRKTCRDAGVPTKAGDMTDDPHPWNTNAMRGKPRCKDEASKMIDKLNSIKDQATLTGGDDS